MRKIRLENPFSDEVWLLTGISHKQYCNYIQKNYPDYDLKDTEKDHDGRMEDPDQEDIKIFLLWVDEKRSKYNQRLSVIHEALHLVTHLFDYCDIPMTKDNDEAMTYLQEYLCHQIFGKLNL